jgi:hypothetical protein
LSISEWSVYEFIFFIARKLDDIGFCSSVAPKPWLTTTSSGWIAASRRSWTPFTRQCDKWILLRRSASTNLLNAFEGIQQRFGATAFALLAHHDFGILKFYNAREERNYDFLSSVSD